MALSALLLSSCSKETGMDVSEGGNIVKLTSVISSPDAGGQSRADGDLTRFPELATSDNVVVIFKDVVSADNTIEEAGTKVTMNVDAEGKFILRDNNVYELPGGGKTLSFYSVWPNDGSVFGYGSAGYPSEKKQHVLGNNSNYVYSQTGNNGELSKSDVMLAVKTGVSDTEVTLNYSHLMSNISVALKKGSGTWAENELENAIVRVHVARAKLYLDYTKLKNWAIGKDNLSNLTETDWADILSIAGSGDANFIFQIDTYVTSTGTDYANYGRAFVPSMWTVNNDTKRGYTYIEIFKDATAAGGEVVDYRESTTNIYPTPAIKVQIPDITFLPNKRYIFNITVGKKTETVASRSGEPSYSVASSEMLVQDCSTGEIIK